MRPRRQKDPARDAKLTEAFHQWFSKVRAPRRPVSGTKWDIQRYPLDWAGWPMVQVDIRMLK